ncbi:hypothetical protein SFRURICE_017348 [Spodoptera frugiperda]|nr:hypothetical protein SFRURICE_017348 [Spodoptera frugiperda]
MFCGRVVVSWRFFFLKKKEITLPHTRIFSCVVSAFTNIQFHITCSGFDSRTNLTRYTLCAIVCLHATRCAAAGCPAIVPTVQSDR